MTADLSIIFFLLLFAAGIKIFTRRHNITLALRKVFIILALVFFITYGVFITTVAFINNIQRQLADVDFTCSLFYSECGLLLLYLSLFLIKKL